jgi:DNA polymerase I-like protein with 3'-5' exonuclease and polymerase domains
MRVNELDFAPSGNVDSGGGLFANKAEPFIFNIRNVESLQVLFFEVLDLEPVKERKHGGGSVDKFFQKKYKDSVPEVKLYMDYNKLGKLKSAFADSILKTLNESEDAKADGRIRNSYWFITVLTGRTSATDPNMQQIPSRGEDAKIIKKQFIAGPGKILIKPDFSAHEIRVTGMVSGDKVIRKTFKIANESIRQLRIASTDEELEEARANYKKNGDVHILNVMFFYNLDVDADHPLRTDVKVTVFQTIYGSQAKSLGRQINKSTEEAQALMDKLFETWSGAKEFMDEVKRTGSKTLRVFSPINRPRHLWAYLHPDQFVGYSMDRRGPNSVMQGLASDIGIEAGYLIQEEIYKTFLKPKLNFDGRLLIMVHDSFTNEVSLQFAPIMMYLQEHGMTTMVQDALKTDFDVEATIPFGFDMNMGLSEGAMKKWSELRRESAEEVFRKIAEEGDGLHRKQLDNALYNLDAIWKIRSRELRDDPYKMLLKGKTEWYAEKMRGMRQI